MDTPMALTSANFQIRGIIVLPEFGVFFCKSLEKLLTAMAFRLGLVRPVIWTFLFRLVWRWWIGYRKMYTGHREVAHLGPMYTGLGRCSPSCVASRRGAAEQPGVPGVLWGLLWRPVYTSPALLSAVCPLCRTRSQPRWASILDFYSKTHWIRAFVRAKKWTQDIILSSSLYWPRIHWSLRIVPFITVVNLSPAVNRCGHVWVSMNSTVR